MAPQYNDTRPLFDMLLTAYPRFLRPEWFDYDSYLWAAELWYSYAFEVGRVLGVRVCVCMRYGRKEGRKEGRRTLLCVSPVLTHRFTSVCPGGVPRGGAGMRQVVWGAGSSSSSSGGKQWQ